MAFKEFLEKSLREISKVETENTLGNRTNYIGASDISGCLRSAYLQKINEVEHSLEKLLIFERGHIAEGIIEKALNSANFKYSSQVEVEDNVLGVPVKAHLDFVVSGKEEIVLEVKTTKSDVTTPYSSWMLQIQFQMGLLKKTTDKNVRGYILVFNLNTGSFTEFPIDFNEELFKVALQKAEILANAMISEEEPPAEEQLYCSSCPFKGQCPIFQAEEIHFELDEDLALIKKLETQKKEIDNQLKAMKTDIEAFLKEKGIKKAKVNDYLISISADSSYVSIDTTKMKKEDPELYQELINDFGKTITRKGSLKIK